MPSAFTSTAVIFYLTQPPVPEVSRACSVLVTLVDIPSALTSTAVTSVCN